MSNGDGASTKIDVTSPYYLGPGDKPGDSITSIRLTLTNFAEWSHDVRVALKSRRKFAFVNGTINEPKTPCTQDDWETIHSMLVSWLSHTISPEVRSLLPKYENAKRLWDDLHERFSVVDGSRIQQLKASLQECRQSKGMAIAVYYGKLCQLWDDLDRHEPIIECKCCTTCTSSKKYVERRESDRLHQFLMGLLSGPYGNLRSVILSQTPLPSVARAFQMLTQEERVQGTEHSSDHTNDTNSAVSSFNVASNTRP